MQKYLSIAAVALLAVAPALAPALAQSSGPGAQTATTKPAAQNWPKPVDNGPHTAAANQAYQGGGVVLQGAPGAPAPTAQPTPPGQTPRNTAP